MLQGPFLQGGLLPLAARLAGSERDRTGVGDDERVERVDEVRAGRLGVEGVDRGPQPREELHERIVLVLRHREVDGPAAAVVRRVSSPPAGRAAPPYPA